MGTSPDRASTADDLPLIGEVFAVELANSHYRSDREDLDFLADADAAATWFGHAQAAADIAMPARIPADSLRALHRVRDATRLVLAEVADGVRSPARDRAAEVLNREAGRAATQLALGVGDDGSATWRLQHGGPGGDVLVTDVASRCILFLGGPDAARVRRCERPDCPMFFVRRHRARRFCHESCAHSIRQARYYRSAVKSRHARPIA